MELDEVKEQAGKYLDANYTCSQSVFKALQDVSSGLKDLDEAMFAGFGGGFACKGKVCGTLVAATAVLSQLKMDRNDPHNRKELYETLRQLYQEIERKNGSMNCY